ncbi:MAG: hypothetical protein IID42_10135 [Planctomycetes bacterium]|nr:hypothetical protein [Planctomycetota bacterium]
MRGAHRYFGFSKPGAYGYGPQVCSSTTQSADYGPDSRRSSYGSSDSYFENVKQEYVSRRDLLVKTIDHLETGSLKPSPQGEDPARRRAPKIGPADMNIDWNQPAANIVNRIRAFSPSPGAVTLLSGKRLKIFSAETGTGRGSPGLVLQQNEQLHVAAQSGSVRCKVVQLEGKQRMATADFLKGRPMAAETVMG